MKRFIKCRNYHLLIGFSPESSSFKISALYCIVKNEDYYIDSAMLETVKSEIKLEIEKMLSSNYFDFKIEREVKITFENKEYTIIALPREEGLVLQLIDFFHLLGFAYENSEEVIFYNTDGLNKVEKDILYKIKSKKETYLPEFKEEFKEVVDISDIITKLKRRGFILIENEKLIPSNKLMTIPFF